MSAPSHDQYSTESKPVSFTVPFILAAVTLLVMGLFLSLCDPTPHASQHEGKSGAAHKKEGHHKATDKDMRSHDEADGPPAHAESPAKGAQHH